MMQVMCNEDPTKICEGSVGRGCPSCRMHQVQATYTLTFKMGWLCPKCQSIYGPSVQECWRCNKMTVTSTIAS